MKPLPVIQPSTPEPARSDSGKIAGMVNDPEKRAALEPQIAAALRKVYDPELPVNIYELGLIYDVIVDAVGKHNYLRARRSLVPGGVFVATEK